MPLERVADVARTSGRSVIMHVGARRVQTVTANLAGEDAEGVQRTLEAQLAATRLPAGVYTELGGTGTAQREARRELLRNSLLAAAGIVMLLWLAFGERSRLLLVLANLPFALVGGVFAVFLTGGLLSLGSLVGFVTLFGIATRNAVMLVSHYDHLVRREGEQWRIETAVRGALERLGPILMTALVTGPRPPAARPGQRRPRPGDRGTDGDRHPGWAGDLDPAQPVRAARARLAVRAVRPAAGGPGGVTGLTPASAGWDQDCGSTSTTETP